MCLEPCYIRLQKGNYSRSTFAYKKEVRAGVSNDVVQISTKPKCKWNKIFNSYHYSFEGGLSFMCETCRCDVDVGYFIEVP